MDCTFCNIISGKIPGDMIYQDRDLVAFRDINPATRVHILIVPRKHIESVNDVSASDQTVLGKLIITAKKIAEHMGITDSGYKLVINTGKDAGQMVLHLHVHLLGGEDMKGGGLC